MLLARFNLSNNQALRWYQETERQEAEIALNDEDILANPYGCHANRIKRDFNPLFATLDAAHKENPTENPKVERFNWHGLRHFAISTWIEAGLSPKTVQTFAGHSSLHMTMDRYGHLFKSDDHKRAMDKIAGELFG